MTASEELAELAELAESIFADAGSADTGFDAALWAVLDAAGLARLTLPESVGGSDATFADAAVVLTAAGAHAARVPLVETDLQAGWLLHAAGLAVPDGPLAVATGAVDLVAVDGGWHATGTLHRVPWARAVSGVAVLAGERVALLHPSILTITDGANLADEPRDAVVVDGGTATVAAAPAGDELAVRGAMGRALLMAGAARGALAAAVRYAGERVQFGRPIGRFQAVQQHLALAAAEVAAVSAAADCAARVATADGLTAPSTRFAVAAAKARAGEAAGLVARIAHQVHGAIGFTREHDLRLLTTRLWSWRDEDGSEAYWHDRIGRLVLDAGPDSLWPLITGTP